jgi:hypothetical protein
MIDILFGLIIGIGHYLNEAFLVKYEKHRPKLISFSAGIAVSYLFLNLFPEFSKGVTQNSIFFFVLGAFTVSVVIEKFIYKYGVREKIMKELVLEDITTSFVYHFIVGLVIAHFVLQGTFEGVLFFIPIFLYTTLGTMPVGVPSHKLTKIILASSTLLGVIASRFIKTTISADFALLGIVVGVLAHSVIRHSIPSGKQGEPWYFLLGAAIYSIVIISGWS